MTVGERIRKRRKELNLTQDELAKRMGYTSRTAISNVEKDLEDLTTTRVKKFANALETTPYVLMGWDNAPDDNDFSDEEKHIIECYRKLSDVEKGMVKRLLNYNEGLSK